VSQCIAVVVVVVVFVGVCFLVVAFMFCKLLLLIAFGQYLDFVR
jgi:hypothetical protein